MKKWCISLFVQKQTTLFDLPLEYSIDGSRYKMFIAQKGNQRKHRVGNQSLLILVMDPDVNVLASFEVTGE